MYIHWTMYFGICSNIIIIERILHMSIALLHVSVGGMEDGKTLNHQNLWVIRVYIHVYI